MIKFPFSEQKVFGNVSCSSDVFGNVARGYSKQCFCASEYADMKVERCALERDHAECVGVEMTVQGAMKGAVQNAAECGLSPSNLGEQRPLHHKVFA